MEGLNSNCFYSKGRKLSASNLSLFPPPSICSTRSPPFLVYPLVCPWVATTNPSIVIIHPLIPVGPCPKLRHCRNRQGCPVCIEGSQALVGRTPTCVTQSVQPNTPQPQIFGGGKSVKRRWSRHSSLSGQGGLEPIGRSSAGLPFTITPRVAGGNEGHVK